MSLLSSSTEAEPRSGRKGTSSEGGEARQREVDMTRS